MNELGLEREQDVCNVVEFGDLRSVLTQSLLVLMINSALGVNIFFVIFLCRIWGGRVCEIE